MNNQLKIMSFSLKLKTYLKRDYNVAFKEKSMILGYDKGTEKRGNLGEISSYMSTNGQFGNKEYQNILCQTANMNLNFWC